MPTDSEWHPTWIDRRLDGGRAAQTIRPTVDERAEVADLAEKQLLRKLRTRSMSVSEARRVLAQHDLSPEQRRAIVDEFLRHGYLDDAALAEQLVHVGVDRKGQGRQVIAQTLAQRGVPRDIADAALSALPDDEAERALEFARSRAARLGDVDDTTALRRLLGQLMRRGLRRLGGDAMPRARRSPSAVAAHRACGSAERRQARWATTGPPTAAVRDCDDALARVTRWFVPRGGRCRSRSSA